MKHPIPRHHLYKDKKGRLVASIRVNGKQCLKRVKSEEQARQWFLLMETESTQASELTFKQLNDAARAFTLLKERAPDLSLTDLVLSYLKDRPTGRSILLGEAIRQYEERSKARVAERTLKGYSQMLRHFKEDLGDIDLASFKKSDAIKYLDRFLSKPPTWRAYHRTLSKFFSEAVKMEWCMVNPFAGIDPPRTAPPERKFLSVKDAEQALRSVLNRKPQLIHFLTLGLFGGLRPIESLRITSKHVNLDTGYIHLSGDITKSHSFKERVVPINETLRAWLTAYPFGEKPIPVNDICYVDKALKDCSMQDHWERTTDNLRHSFATYEFARSRNSAETAAICGHSEAIACKHYRGRVTPEEADRFFALIPSRLRA